MQPLDLIFAFLRVFLLLSRRTIKTEYFEWSTIVLSFIVAEKLTFLFYLPEIFCSKKNSGKTENHAISEQMSSLTSLRVSFSDSTAFFPSETPIESEALKNIK